MNYFRTSHIVALATVLFAGSFPSHAVKYTHKVNDQYTFDYEISGAGAQQSIQLTITANTSGWVGFGVGPNPNMEGADLFIAGRNGTENYSGDYHAEDGPPIRDTVQNWDFGTATETGTLTTVTVNRLLNTADAEHDFIITNTTMNVVWAYGEKDIIEYHGTSRGAIRLNLMAVPDTNPTTTTPGTTTAGAPLVTGLTGLLVTSFSALLLATK